VESNARYCYIRGDNMSFSLKKKIMGTKLMDLLIKILIKNKSERKNW